MLFTVVSNFEKVQYRLSKNLGENLLPVQDAAEVSKLLVTADVMQSAWRRVARIRA